MSQGMYIEQIALKHMEMEIDIHEILLKRHPGSEQYIAIYLIQGYYHQIANALGEDADKRLYKRALDHAKFLAIQRLPDLKHETEAALYFMLDEAERTGWFHSDFIGFDSLEELLANIIDPDSMGLGEVGDWRFIATEMIPAARRFGVAPDQLFAASCQVKKLRGSVPTTRQILKELEVGDITEEEAEKDFKQIVEWVADPKISFTQFEINTGKREPPERLAKIKVYEIVIPGGDKWLLIPTETETDRQIVSKMLNHRMTKKYRALPWLMEKIQEKLGRSKTK